MPKFDRNAFLSAANEGEDKEFIDVPSGTYELELTHTGFKEFESNAENVSLGFQLTDANEQYVGQMVWWNQNITKKDGTQNDIGVQQLCSWCMKMSGGRFNVDAFLDDPEAELERFQGTVVLAKVTKKEKDGYINYDVIHRRTRTVVYDNPKEENSSDVNMTEQIAEERELQIGDNVSFKKAGGLAVGKVVSFAGNNLEGYVEVAIEGHENFNVDVKDIVAIAGNIEDYKERLFQKDEESLENEDDDDILDEEPVVEIPKLEKGQKVSYIFNGEKFISPIHDINEDEGTLRVVIVRDDGKKAARKLNISDVTVIS